MVAPLTPAPQPPSGSIEVVVDKVEQALALYLQGAAPLGLELTPADILEVIDRLAGHPEGAVAPEFGTDVRGFFMGGLFEELAQQPGQIYEKVADPEGGEAYAPLTPAVWKDCLARLRARVAALQ